MPSTSHGEQGEKSARISVEHGWRELEGGPRVCIVGVERQFALAASSITAVCESATSSEACWSARAWASASRPQAAALSAAIVTARSACECEETQSADS